MLKEVRYPNGAQGTNDVPIMAHGRSGWMQCAGLNIIISGSRIEVRPITSKGKPSDSARIDIPRCSLVLTSLIETLMEIREDVERDGE